MKRMLISTLLLFSALLLAACSSARGGAPVPTPVPTFTPAADDFILDDASAAVGPALMAGLKVSPYQEFPTFDEEGNSTGNVVGVMSFQGVSSGQREARTIDGHEVKTLGVYLLMQDGDVLDVPVAVEVDGESFVSLPEQDVITTTTLTEDFTPISVTLTYVNPFERGALVTLVSTDGIHVQPNTIDWSGCGDAFCTLGRKMDADYPDAFFLLTLRALQDVPDGWVLFGFDVVPPWGETKDQLIVQIPEVRQ